MQYLLTLKEKLEENGIPAVIHGDNTARMIIPAFLLEPTLWVYLDEQFEDAVKLIDDPNHEVTTGIDVEDFYTREVTPDEQSKALNQVLVDFGLSAAFIALVMFILVRILHALQT